MSTAEQTSGALPTAKREATPRRSPPESIAAKFRLDVQHFGLIKATYSLAMKGINLFVDLRIVRVLAKDVVDPRFLECPPGHECRFPENAELLALAGNPENELTESFVRAAIDRGDECCASFAGSVLTGVTWYSHRASDDEGLTFHFPANYVYSYAGFTNPNYRGQRLSVIRAAHARREYLARGFQGTLGLVDSHNFRSLKSSAATPGNQCLGTILVLKLRRRAWIYNNRRCRQHGVYLAKPETIENRPTN